MGKSLRWRIGIDEVGRGPLAGPVTLCACMAGADFGTKGSASEDWFSGIRDSKQLSEKKREEWLAKAESARAAGHLRWAVVSKSASDIDRLGIAAAIREAVAECLAELAPDVAATAVMLDGSLKAPAIFTHQETIIKGDEKIPLISMASVIAKVTRDRHMAELALAHAAYGFDKHKGYGTAAHRATIRKLGPTAEHRLSFLRNILGTGAKSRS